MPDTPSLQNINPAPQGSAKMITRASSPSSSTSSSSSALLPLPLRQLAVAIFLFLLLLALPVTFQYHRGSCSTTPTTYNVTPNGEDDRRVLQAGPAGDTRNPPLPPPPSPPPRVIHTLAHALKVAKAGDTIILGDGVYHARLVSSRGGKQGHPITVVGGVNAVIKAPSDPIEINHSWITIQGFSVDGTIYDDKDGKKSSFVDKCVRIDGRGRHSKEKPLEGFVMKGMTIRNCGGECVRLKNFVQRAEITGNTLEYCGRKNFPLRHNNDRRENKNGEGVYIGTSSQQTGKDAPLDRCSKNLIRGNTIATHGNECVEVKEGSSRNVIEYNVCSNQLDVNSGCLGSRGDANTFRYNDVFDCLGAGVRLGGHRFRNYQFGQGNTVCGNNFNRVTVGSIRVMIDQPQGVICSNSCRDGSCFVTGNDRAADVEATWDEACKIGTPCDGL